MSCKGFFVSLSPLPNIAYIINGLALGSTVEALIGELGIEEEVMFYGW